MRPGLDTKGLTPADQPPAPTPPQSAAPRIEASEGRRHTARLARNISVLGISQALTWTLTLAWTFLIPRLVGPAGMGLIVMATAASQILFGLGGLGSRPFLVREIASDPDRAPELLGTAFMVRAALVVPSAGLTVLYVHLAGFHGAQALALYLGAGLAAFLLLGEVGQAGLQAIERMEYLAANDVLNKGLQAMANIPMALLGFAVDWLIAAQVAIGGLLLGLNLLWTRRFRIDWTVRLNRVVSFLRSSLAYWVFAVFQTLYLWLDATMLSLMVPQEVVGWYGVPSRLFQTMMFLPVILSNAWLPRLAAAYRRSPQELRSAARTPVEITLVLSLPIGVGTALVARPVILLIFGPAFEPSIPVLEILALASIPMYVSIMMANVLIAANRQAVWTKAMIVASVLNPAINLVLIRLFQDYRGNGALGAAFTLLVTETIVVALAVWIIRNYLDLGSLFRRLAKAVPATAGMAAVAWPLGHFSMALEVIGGALAFGLLAFLLRVLTPDEYRELTGLAGAAVRRLRGGSRPGGGAADEGPRTPNPESGLPPTSRDGGAPDRNR